MCRRWRPAFSRPNGTLGTAAAVWLPQRGRGPLFWATPEPLRPRPGRRSHRPSSGRACRTSSGGGFRKAVKSRSGKRLRNPPGSSSATIVSRWVDASTAPTLSFPSRMPEDSKALMLVSPMTTTNWPIVSGSAADGAAGLAVRGEMSAGTVLTSYGFAARALRQARWVGPAAPRTRTCRCHRVAGERRGWRRVHGPGLLGQQSDSCAVRLMMVGARWAQRTNHAAQLPTSIKEGGNCGTAVEFRRIYQPRPRPHPHDEGPLWPALHQQPGDKKSGC